MDTIKSDFVLLFLDDDGKVYARVFDTYGEMREYERTIAPNRKPTRYIKDYYE